MKTIYYITDIRLRNWLAETIHVSEICKNLSELGCTVDLYVPDSEVNLIGEYVVHKIKTVKLFGSLLFQLKLFFRLLKDSKKNRPTLIYSRHSNLLFLPVAFSKIFGIPCILEVNGKLVTESRNVGTSIVASVLYFTRIFAIIERFNLRYCSGIIVPAGGIKDHLIKSYNINSDKIDIITNGVDLEFFKPRSQRISREELGLNKTSIYVGYIGGFFKWQGIPYILKAAKIICSKRKDIQFMIVGKGDDYDRISKYIKQNNLEDCVTLHDPVPHHLVPLYLNAFDICISYPNKSRANATSPFKLYEYLACGKPVISSDIAGMRSEFGSTIRYVPAESPQKLADEILTLTKDVSLRNELRKRGRHFVEEGHGWRDVTKRTLAVFQKYI